MRRTNGPHEQLQYWQGHMRSEWSTGPRPAKPAKKGDNTTLNVPAKNHAIRRNQPDNRKITRTMRRHTITNLVTRINRAPNAPTWAHNLAGGLSWWLTENPHVETYTITTVTNGQWRILSRVK